MPTILVPLDGSAHAEQILPYLGPLAWTLRARVRLLHVCDDTEQATLIANGVGAMYDDDEGLPTRKEYVRRAWDIPSRHPADELAAHAAGLRAAGVGVDVEECLGSPTERIVAVAEREPDTLIALVTHGYGGLRRWALGSIADQVIHATTRPVFIVRDGVAAPENAHTFKRILVPLDGSAVAREAIPFAMALARGAGSELLLLRAVEPVTNYPVVLDTQRRHTAQALEMIADELRGPGVPVSTMVGVGRAAGVIVTWAAHCHADLIVMATHGYSGFRRWALGSVADTVLHTTTAPLLLVRAHSGPA
jgi:nucleotide-binding universal stress UspA family protein